LKVFANFSFIQFYRMISHTRHFLAFLGFDATTTTVTGLTYNSTTTTAATAQQQQQQQQQPAEFHGM
jgi:hypothetical protein